MDTMKKMKKILILFLCAILVTAPVFTETAFRSSKNSFIRGEEDFVSSKKEKDTDQRLVQMFKWQKKVL